MGFDYTKLTSGEFKLPSGWRVVTVQDVAVVNEQNIRKKYKHEVIEYIDVSSVEKGLVKTTKILPLRDAPSRARRIVRDQDILISTVRPSLQHYAFIKKSAPNTVASTGFAVVTAKQVEPRYLYYYLTSKAFTEYLTAIAESHTSAYPAFNPDVIEKAELLLPPNSEQRAIAHILGTLDDKIELNRQMNETLEAMAQTIFKSWFVDFDPVVVNAIKAGNPIPDKFAERAAHYRADPDSLGLPDHILNLFPDRFVDSDLGPIPGGWGIKSIGEITSIVGGSTPSTKNPKYWKGGSNPFLTPRDMASLNSPIIFDTERHITDAGVEKISSKQLPPGTVLLSSRAPIGYLAINNVPLSVNQGIIGIICDRMATSYYIYFWAKANLNKIKARAGGTTFPEISKKAFKSIPILVPRQGALSLFSTHVDALFAKIARNLKTNLVLTKIHNKLLPKLVSGELRVPDVERILEGPA